MINIAIDLGGTRIKTGVMRDHEPVGFSIIPSCSDGPFEDSMENLTKQIDALLGKYADNEPVHKIGLGFAGLANIDEGRVVSTNEKFDGAADFDFKKWALEHWNAGFVIENDARAALLGEWRYGAGRGYDDIVMMTIGTGIGGVAMIEGKLLKGKHHQAGLLGGHFTIDYNGDTCTCGNIGCVEAEASTWKLEKLVKNHELYTGSLLAKSPKIDYREVFGTARLGDKLAVEIMHHSMKVWAAGVVNMIHAYDPELVILHGGIMESADIILPFITEYVHTYAWTPWGKVKIVRSELHDHAALLGMDYLCEIH